MTISLPQARLAELRRLIDAEAQLNAELVEVRSRMTAIVCSLLPEQSDERSVERVARAVGVEHRLVSQWRQRGHCLPSS